MTPAEILQARQTLGLSRAQLAAMLDLKNAKAVQCMETDPSAAMFRSPPVRAVRLLRAYLDGHRPPDWPV
jgi:DNA-binding transcriptional regulator YiaG